MIEIKVNCKGSHDFKLSELFILLDTKDFQLKELNKNNFEKLKNGIIKKGFWFPFFVWHCEEEGKWYYTDGTQRHKVLNKMAESGQYKMPDKFPCVEIFAKDKKEAAEAILTQSSSYGKFTEEGLYGFIHEYDLVSDFAELKGGLEIPDFDLGEFEKGWLKDDPVGGEGDDSYSKKIEAPIYEPKNEKPPVDELFDKNKTADLIKEIEESNIYGVEKEFLILAAQRHTIFNYQNIADYYAHSPKNIQELMEKSALIIIDFKQAIENGYVKLSEEIAVQFLKDYPDADK